MSESQEFKSLAATTSWGRGRIFDDITETIGQTPMVRLKRLAATAKTNAEILLKLEFFNPLSSVKDRIGVAMIDALEAEGRITPGRTVLVEPTSGNTGIALAFAGAARGYKVILVMPESMSLERRKILKHLGAQLELTPSAEGMTGAIARARELVAALPDAIEPGQFVNPANPRVHELTTAEEIWNDTGGQLDALIAGVGTGGTLTGCGRALRARLPGLQVIAVEPSESPVLSGGEPGAHKIQGIGAGFVPEVLDVDLIDEVVKVPSEMAIEVARLLALVEGIPAGISSGANVAAALTVAMREDMSGKTIVTFAPSSAERYYSSPLFASPEGEEDGA